MGNLDKQEYYQRVSERISSVLSKKGITQKQLVLLCGNNGLSISQGTISKILSGGSMSLYQMVQICNILNLNVSEVFSLDEDAAVTVGTGEGRNETPLLITDARNPAFHGYKGSFYVYFYPTQSNDSELIPGKMEVDTESPIGRCRVKLSFGTGHLDRNNEPIKKEYVGEAVLSPNMQTIYCSLQCSAIGEISYLLYHYHFIAFEELECRLATVITASAGSKRLPTMHRMLMSRRELGAEELYILSGQLCLNESEMLISETAYKQFLKDPKLPPSFTDYFGDAAQESPGFTSSVPKIPYYYFNESIISDSFLPAVDKAKIICLLRRYSTAPHYNKVSDKADEIIFKYIKSLKPGD